MFLSQKYLRIESVLCRFHVFSRALVPETRHSPADIVLFAIFFLYSFAPPPEKTFPIKSLLQAYGGPRVRGDDEARPGSAVTSLAGDVTMSEADAMLANYAEDLKLNEVRFSLFFKKRTERERDTHTDTLFLKHTHRGAHTDTLFFL